MRAIECVALERLFSCSSSVVVGRNQGSETNIQRLCSLADTHQQGVFSDCCLVLLGRYKASKTELQRLCGTEGLSWEGFLRKVRERTGEEDEDEEVRQAFKVLDRSCQGFLCLSDVKVR